MASFCLLDNIIIAILYPGTEIGSDLFKSLIYMAYWPLYGEMTFLEIIKDESLSNEGAIYAYASTIIYVCIANVLLCMFFSFFTLHLKLCA